MREKAVDDLFEAQTGDFYGMFKAMDGLPVIVRLLDPPLHEFLESPRALDVEIARLEAAGGDAAVIAEKRQAHGADRRHERGQPDAGPARLPSGHRVSHPARRCRCAPSPPLRPSSRRRASTRKPEIMIPLVSVVTELARSCAA